MSDTTALRRLGLRLFEAGIHGDVWHGTLEQDADPVGVTRRRGWWLHLGPSRDVWLGRTEADANVALNSGALARDLRAAVEGRP